MKSLAEGESIIEFIFDRKPSTVVKDLTHTLYGVRIVVVDYNYARINSGMAAMIFAEVFQLAKDTGLQMRSVNSINPTLEDSFIKLIGMRPTMMATEKGG